MTDTKPHFDYIKEATVTLSNNFHGELLTSETVRVAILRAIKALKDLDVVKKTLFYGRAVPENFTLYQSPAIGQNASPLPYMFDNAEFGEKIIHGIIGSNTEGGELLELLYAVLFEGKKFDVVNAEEETGDAFWYQAVIASACGFTFDAAQRRNIAKLRHRFPNAFTEHDALNRDLFGEREILESETPASMTGLTIDAGVVKPAEVDEAAELLKALGLIPDRFRSEGGLLNIGKVKAALAHPEDYKGYYLAKEREHTLSRDCWCNPTVEKAG